MSKTDKIFWREAVAAVPMPFLDSSLLYIIIATAMPNLGAVTLSSLVEFLEVLGLFTKVETILFYFFYFEIRKNILSFGKDKGC